MTKRNTTKAQALNYYSINMVGRSAFIETKIDIDPDCDDTDDLVQEAYDRDIIEKGDAREIFNITKIDLAEYNRAMGIKMKKTTKTINVKNKLLTLKIKTPKKKAPAKKASTPLVVVGTGDFSEASAPAPYMIVEFTKEFIATIKKLRKVVKDNNILIAETTTVPSFKYINDTLWMKKVEKKALDKVGGVVVSDCNIDEFLDIGEETEFNSDSTTLKVSSDKIIIVENCDGGEVFANVTFDLIKDLL